MTRRLALTPAIGGLATASVVSFSAVSMWLAGVHDLPAHATNPCSTKSVKKTAAHTTAAVHTAARQTPAHPPVLLDAAVRTISTGRPGQHATSHGAAATTTGTAATTSTSPPVPSTGPQPSTPAGSPPVPNPSPGGGAVTPSSNPGNSNPGSSGNIPAKGSSHSPTIAPGGTNNSPTATPTPTSTPTPTPSSTTTPPPSGTLCLSVQVLGGSNTVQPGTTVHFAIWVWLTSGTDGTAKLSVGSTRKGVNPTFTVCQTAGKSTCTVSGLNTEQAIQSQAKLRAFQDLAGRHITVTVSATSKQATNTATASDKITVAAKHGSSSPTPTPANNGAGAGGVLPNTGLPGSGGNSFPGASNPYSSGSFGSALPQVSPSPNVSPTTAKQQRQHRAQLTDLSGSLPLTVRLIGGQAIGLAILAAAVTIAVARLSLRRQPARHSDDNTNSTPST
jgi:hypothetical protein